MNILIINPGRVDNYAVVREERFEHKDIGSVYPPLSLLYVGAILKKEHNVKFIDANGFDLSFEDVIKEIGDFKVELIISRIAFDTQYKDLDFLSKLKEINNAKLIVRSKIIGDIKEIRKELMRKYPIDVFVNLELESVIKDLVDNIDNLDKVKSISYKKDNKTIDNEYGDVVEDLDKFPFPAYDLLPSIEPYHTGIFTENFALIATTKGCPFQCTFCAFSKMKYRKRSPENVVGELEYLIKNFNLKSFLFFDDTVSLEKERLMKICEFIIERNLKLKWGACTRANLLDEELLTLMKKAGCVEIPIGIETGSEEILKNVKKDVSLDEIREAFRLCKKIGILAYGLVIIGLPGENNRTVEETIEFIKEVDPFYTQFCFSVPFPNTEMYKYYEDNNLLLTKDWNKYCPLEEEPVIRTKELSKEDLIKLRKRAYMKILFRPGYLIRKIRWNDLRWSFNAGKELIKRSFALVRGRGIR